MNDSMVSMTGAFSGEVAIAGLRVSYGTRVIAALNGR
jgi:hypothetical protein